MKSKRNFIIFFAALFAAICLVIFLRGKILNPPERAVRDSLLEIEHLDASSAADLFSQSLSGAQGASFSGLSEEEKEALRLFFKDFSFRILGSSVESSSATVKVDASAVDAKQLAVHMRERQLSMGFNRGDTSVSGQDPAGIYSLMKDVLSSEELGKNHIVENISVIKSKSGWSVVSDSALKHLLTGGLIEALNDPYLLSPEDVVSVYLDRFSDMTPEEWEEALQSQGLLNGSSGSGSSVSSASLSSVVKTCFTKISEAYGYRIKSVRTEGSVAEVEVSITSIDMTEVLASCRKKLLEYARTADSAAADPSALSGKTASFLQEALEEDVPPKDTEISFRLKNDGTIWQLTDTSGLFNALLGDITSAVKSFNNN